MVPSPTQHHKLLSCVHFVLSGTEGPHSSYITNYFKTYWPEKIDHLIISHNFADQDWAGIGWFVLVFHQGPQCHMEQKDQPDKSCGIPNPQNCEI